MRRRAGAGPRPRWRPLRRGGGRSVARWWVADAPHIEPPEWYRNFHPEDWDEPDGHEVTMTGGRDVRDEPGHVTHARPRCEQAKIGHRPTHPSPAEHELNRV